MGVDASASVLTSSIHSHTCAFLSPWPRTAIVSGAPVSVLIHSARSAKTFLDLLRKFGLHHWLGSVTVYGISANALSPLEGAGFGALVPAHQPNEDALLALLDETSELARASNAS